VRELEDKCRPGEVFIRPNEGAALHPEAARLICTDGVASGWWQEQIESARRTRSFLRPSSSPALNIERTVAPNRNPVTERIKNKKKRK
jgi:hypothetical protein